MNVTKNRFYFIEQAFLTCLTVLTIFAFCVVGSLEIFRCWTCK